VIVVGRDVFIPLLIPVLKTRGYSSLPVHFVGKIATFSLLYAFPLVLLGSGEEGWLQLAWVVGWAFAIWGTALYWYAGGLYLIQTARLLRSTPPIHGRRPSSVTR
jgi:cardiolipin synthase